MKGTSFLVKVTSSICKDILMIESQLQHGIMTVEKRQQLTEDLKSLTDRLDHITV